LGPPPLGRTPPPESRKEPRPNRHPLPRNSSPTHTCCAPSAPDLYDAKCATCNSCNHPTARRWDATARQSRSQNYKRLWGRRGPLVRSACTSGGQEERERSRNEDAEETEAEEVEAEETDAEGMEAEEAPSKAPPLLRVRRYCSLTSADGLEGTRLGRAVCR
ncbi:unnamed protein product, partial [Prorocentrum cordatum]